MSYTPSMILTGHLSTYPLPDLIKTLHIERKTGRLKVEYEESPGTFHFEEGRLVDVQLGTLRGLEALYVALSLRGGSFNFNPLIRPPDKTVQEHEQVLISNLLGASPHDEALGMALSGGEEERHPGALQPASVSALAKSDLTPVALPEAPEEKLAVRLSNIETRVAAYQRQFSRERMIYAGLIAALLLIAIIPRFRNQTPETAALQPPAARVENSSSSIAVNDREAADRPELKPANEPGPAKSGESGETDTRKQQSKSLNTAQAERQGQVVKQPSPTPTPAKARPESAVPPSNPKPADEQVVHVTMKVERGRVTQAIIKNPKSRMEAYEALALRLARQRRYPEGFSGQDTLSVKVKP